MAETQISTELAEAEHRRTEPVSGSIPGANLVSGAFRSLATLRRARGFHPNGLLLTGELETHVGGVFGLHQKRHPVTARLSKGVGAPGAVPDILGLALRVHDPDGPWDLTLVTAGTTTLGRLVLRPAISWSRARFSSLAPYATDAGLRWFIAEFDGDYPGNGPSIGMLERLVERTPIELELSSASATGTRRPAARIRLTEAHPDASHTAFDPMEFEPPGMRLYPGWLSRLREVAYHGSRVGRDRHER